MSPQEILTCIHNKQQKSSCVIIHCRNLQVLQQFLLAPMSENGILSFDFYVQLNAIIECAFHNTQITQENSAILPLFCFSDFYNLYSPEYEESFISASFISSLFSVSELNIISICRFYSTKQYIIYHLVS